MCDLDNVRVAVRIRPMVESELARGSQVAVEKVAQAEKVLVNNTDAFTYNFVFDGNESQEQVYQKTVSEMIDRLFCGFNATILAYGQTGSGKTYTMGTSFDGCLDEDIGVIPRAMQDIFDRIEKCSNQTEFLVKCSFMELYQEQLYDLLSTKPKDESVVDLREDRTSIFFVGLTEEVVRSSKETTNCLMRGSLERAVGATAMNQHSSRSHAIFTVTIRATSKTESQNVTTSKFHLVDLAGSERLKKAQFTEDRLKEGIKINQDFNNILSAVCGNGITSKQTKGDRFKEGVKINQGLLALGNVISALGDGKGGGFVRYRDSKLTRLLQDSLGGNSVTLMIACVSPADYNVTETLSTLRYADRARKIKNKPIVNQDPHAAEINRLNGIIQKLRLDLLAQGGGMSSSIIKELDRTSSNNDATCTSMDALLPTDVQNSREKEIEKKYRRLQQQWHTTLNDVVEHEIRAFLLEVTQDKTKSAIKKMKTIFGNLLIYRDPERKIDYDEFNKTLDQVHTLMNSIESEVYRCEVEIMDHKKQLSLPTSVDDDSGNSYMLEIHELMQDHVESFIKKQMEINEQLRRVNHELYLKEQLQQRMNSNFQKFSGIEENIEEKAKANEMKIVELEVERKKLLEKFPFSVTNKSEQLVDEETEKRLQALDREISEKKCISSHQSKILKVHEKEILKLKELRSEIQTMKESKVKILRTMRKENENFRQFKMLREKELLQVRNKTQQLKENLREKEAVQPKLLKRKFEEAVAVNKRLKEVLERYEFSRNQRQKILTLIDGSETLSRVDQFTTLLEREYDVMTSLVDAEISIEQLLEDRSIINARIEKLSQSQSDLNPNVEQELMNLREELELRNAQIDDLQQKIYASDLDSHINSVGDNINSMMEARAALKHLCKTTLNMRRAKTQSIEELRSQLSMAEDKCAELTRNLETSKRTQQDIIQEYEEKIELVLTPEQNQNLKRQEEQQKTIDKLMRKVENYAQLLQNNLALSTNMSKDKMEGMKLGETRSKKGILQEISNVSNYSENEAKEKDKSSSPVFVTPSLIQLSTINFTRNNTRKFFE